MKFVGPGEIYTTITGAISASFGGGEVIVIASGTYNEAVVINKWVSLRGNTDTPENGDVVIDGGSSYAININHTPTSSESIYIEGVKCIRDVSNWVIVVAVGNSNSNLSVYLNRCIVDDCGTYMYSISLQNKNFDKFYIENCYIDKGYSHLLYANWNNITAGCIVKVQLDIAYSCYSCTYYPHVHDVVITPTLGYGPAYGTYYNSIYDGCFSGYVSEEQIPVSRELFLYNRVTGDLITTTTSSGNGYYYLKTTFSGSHNIVCLDDVAGVKYNDLVSGNVFPTTISG